MLEDLLIAERQSGLGCHKIKIKRRGKRGGVGGGGGKGSGKNKESRVHGQKRREGTHRGESQNGSTFDSPSTFDWPSESDEFISYHHSRTNLSQRVSQRGSERSFTVDVADPEAEGDGEDDDPAEDGDAETTSTSEEGKKQEPPPQPFVNLVNEPRASTRRQSAGVGGESEGRRCSWRLLLVIGVGSVLATAGIGFYAWRRLEETEAKERERAKQKEILLKKKKKVERTERTSKRLEKRRTERLKNQNSVLKRTFYYVLDDVNYLLRCTCSAFDSRTDGKSARALYSKMLVRSTFARIWSLLNADSAIFTAEIEEGEERRQVVGPVQPGVMFSGNVLAIAFCGDPLSLGVE